jgi:hypothetical protein
MAVMSQESTQPVHLRWANELVMRTLVAVRLRCAWQ